MTITMMMTDSRDTHQQYCASKKENTKSTKWVKFFQAI
jgi:hypothetical protein